MSWKGVALSEAWKPAVSSAGVADVTSPSIVCVSTVLVDTWFRSEIVVVRDVLERGGLIGSVEAGGFVCRRRGRNQSIDRVRFNGLGGHVVQRAINRSRRQGAGGQNARAHEVAAIEIDFGGSDLTGGYSVRLFHRAFTCNMRTAHLPRCAYPDPNALKLVCAMRLT